MKKKEKKNNMVEKEVEKVEEAKKEETVSKKEYDDLLKAATDLQGRYEKLAKLYNLVIEQFLSGK